MGELVVVLLFMIVVVPVVTVAFAMVVLEDTSAMLVVGLLALVTGVVLVDLSILGVIVWVGVLVAGVIRLCRPSRGTYPPCNGGSRCEVRPPRQGSFRGRSPGRRPQPVEVALR
ncbi:MAG: hypothetical protein ACRDRK_02665 [Pseudonocardia sp.]